MMKLYFWLYVSLFGTSLVVGFSTKQLSNFIGPTASNNDFGSMFIEAIMNGTKTAVEQYLLTAPDATFLCSDLNLRLDNRFVANYSTLQVLMIESQSVNMRISSAPGFCRLRIIAIGAPLPAAEISQLQYQKRKIAEILSTNKDPDLLFQIFSSTTTPDTSIINQVTPLQKHSTVIYFNLTSQTPEFECDFIGNLMGYSNIVIQLQQNATTWHDLYKFRLSIARPQPLVHFILQQTTTCVIFVANLIAGLLLDFRLMQSAIRQTSLIIVVALSVKLLIMPGICFALFYLWNFDPDLTSVGMMTTTFAPCGLEAILHCVVLTTTAFIPRQTPQPVKATSKQKTHTGHHHRRKPIKADIFYTQCVTSSAAITLVLNVASIGWLPLGVTIFKYFTLPTSLVRDPADKFLYFENSPPGFEVMPYASCAISVGCLILPLSIGVIIRRRFHEQIDTIARWLVTAIFLSLVAVCTFTTVTSLVHVAPYISESILFACLFFAGGTILSTFLMVILNSLLSFFC